ncbi:MAG: DUF423 domain-containing protein [Janthinobacterium lividum]
MLPSRLWLGLGALMGALAVAAAAYSAHAPIDPSRVRAVSSAVQMQGWHALALVACGLLGGYGGWTVNAAGSLFLLGTLLFAGAVWVPQFGGPSLGMVAPVGGTMLMLGWLALAVAAFRAA